MHINGAPTDFMARLVDRSGCWEWTSFTDRHGYGRFTFEKRLLLAHRASWMFHNGSIPAGLCVLHRCDNPLCVKPEHLFLGTIADNNRDAMQKGRLRRAVCKRGHALVGENVMVIRGGLGRRCLTCFRAGNRTALRAFYERKRLSRAS